MAIRKSFLGTGWGFPVEFIKKPISTVRMISLEADIAESLRILLGTRPGERIMRPFYGINMEDMVFEPVTANLKTYIKELITRAILYYEPRIDLLRIDIISEEVIEGRFKIELEYAIRTTNSRFNFVYDYYLREATIISQ